MTPRSVQSLVTRHDVVSVAPETTVRRACELMSEQHVGAVLIMTDGRLEGIFTERDALKRVLAKGADPDDTPISRVMTADPVTLTPDAWALDALRLMSQVGIRHLPIVDQDIVVGMISLRDFVGAELQQAGGTWGSSSEA